MRDSWMVGSQIDWMEALFDAAGDDFDEVSAENPWPVVTGWGGLGGGGTDAAYYGVYMPMRDCSHEAVRGISVGIMDILTFVQDRIVRARHFRRSDALRAIELTFEVGGDTQLRLAIVQGEPDSFNWATLQ